MDYIDFQSEFTLFAGDTERCIAIMIIADTILEMDETFLVSVEEFGISATVNILDDDGVCAYE